MFELKLLLGFTCRRCGEFFTSETRAERMAEIALFGMTKEVCPLCCSTPEERGGKPLPPPPPEDDEPEEDDDQI